VLTIRFQISRQNLRVIGELGGLQLRLAWWCESPEKTR
jgi:hypothetical protein